MEVELLQTEQLSIDSTTPTAERSTSRHGRQWRAIEFPLKGSVLGFAIGIWGTNLISMANKINLGPSEILYSGATGGTITSMIAHEFISKDRILRPLAIPLFGFLGGRTALQFYNKFGKEGVAVVAALVALGYCLKMGKDMIDNFPAEAIASNFRWESSLEDLADELESLELKS